MRRRLTTSASRLSAATLVAAAMLGVLVACAPSPGPQRTEPAVAPSPSASATASGPVFLPDGTAEENLPVFTATAESVWAGESRGAGRAYVDALTSIGFDKGAMQVTQDASTVGNAAESLQFSVRWGEKECLIGQVGPSTGQVVTAVMPQLAEGRCLIGTTRSIDW